MSAPTKNVVSLPVAATVERTDKLLMVDIDDTSEGPLGTVKIAEGATVAQVFAQELNAAALSAAQAADSAAAAAAITGLSTVQNFTNPLARAVRVAMTGVLSGSSGIRVLNNANANLGTNNFTLVWKGALPDWSPIPEVFLVEKYQSINDRWGFLVKQDGALRLSATVGGVEIFVCESTVSIESAGYAAWDALEISVSMVRERVASVGSAVFAINGVQLGGSVSIAAASTVSIDNTGSVGVCTDFDGNARAESATQSFTFYNRALSAAEVLSLAVNGPALADLGASQTPRYSADFSAGTGPVSATNASIVGNQDGISDGNTSKDNCLLVTLDSGANGRVRNVASSTYTVGVHEKTRIDYYIPSGQAITNIQIRSNGTDVIITPAAVVGQWTSVEFEYLPTSAAQLDCRIYGVGAADGDVFYVQVWNINRLGITAQYNAQDAQSDTGQIFDSSGNKNHALLPAAGATIVGAIPSRQRQVRSRHAWVATSELQYWSGVNQDILPAGAAMEYIDIFSNASLSVNIGNGTAATFYASAVALTAGWNRITLAGFYAGTTVATRKLTVTPTATATAVLNCTATYHTTETA